MCVAFLVALIAGPVTAAAQSSAASTDGAAASLVSGIQLDGFDTAVQPQEDFYLYANGKWLQDTEIPADKSEYGIFALLKDQSQEALRKLVEDAAANSDNPPGSDEQKVGDLYRSFMNTERLQQLGAQPLEPHLQRIAAVQDKSALARLMADNLRYGVNGAFVLFVTQDARKSDEYIVYLSQAGLSLPDRDYYLKDDEQFVSARQALVAYINNLLSAAEYPDAAGAAQRILELET
jgi:endothelin-converting enzyme